MREFLKHGYEGARVDRIVAAAKVSKATLYRHFPNKETLFTALIQRMASKKELFQLQNLQSLEEEPATFLRRYAIGMLENVANDPQVLTFLRMIIGDSGRFPELARAFILGIEKPSLTFLTHYFEKHPKLHLPDPEVAARMFVGTLIHFVIVRDVLHGGDILPMPDDRLIENLLKTLCG